MKPLLSLEGAVARIILLRKRICVPFCNFCTVSSLSLLRPCLHLYFGHHTIVTLRQFARPVFSAVSAEEQRSVAEGCAESRYQLNSTQLWRKTKKFQHCFQT